MELLYRVLIVLEQIPKRKHGVANDHGGYFPHDKKNLSWASLLSCWCWPSAV